MRAALLVQQVDGKTQAAILDALGDEYRANGPILRAGTTSSDAHTGDAADIEWPGRRGH